jgi:hypothetical protein
MQNKTPLGEMKRGEIESEESKLAPLPLPLPMLMPAVALLYGGYPPPDNCICRYRSTS